MTMPRKVNLTGRKFERLTVIGPEFENVYNGRWKAICNCEESRGEVRIYRGSSLTSGNTKSCGCMRKRNKGRPAVTQSVRNFLSRSEFLNQCVDAICVMDAYLKDHDVTVKGNKYYLHGTEYGPFKNHEHATFNAIMRCVRATDVGEMTTYRPTVENSNEEEQL
jgi:hypothetical protein